MGSTRDRGVEVDPTHLLCKATASVAKHAREQTTWCREGRSRAGVRPEIDHLVHHRAASDGAFTNTCSDWGLAGELGQPWGVLSDQTLALGCGEHSAPHQATGEHQGE